MTLLRHLERLHLSRSGFHHPILDSFSAPKTTSKSLKLENCFESIRDWWRRYGPWAGSMTSNDVFVNGFCTSCYSSTYLTHFLEEIDFNFDGFHESPPSWCTSIIYNHSDYACCRSTFISVLLEYFMVQFRFVGYKYIEI